MKAIRILFVVAILSLAAVAQQQVVDTPATKEDILQMFKEMRFEQQMQGIMTAINKQLDGFFQSQMDKPEFQKMSPAQKEKFREFMTTTMKEAMELYPVTEIIDDFAPVYAKYMTKADVQAISAFYKSPSGKKMLDNAPQISAEGMAIMMPKMQARMNDYMTKMQQRVQEMLKEEGTAPQSTGK